MGQFPSYKTKLTRPQDRVKSVRNRRQLKLILAMGHSGGWPPPCSFVSQPCA